MEKLEVKFALDDRKPETPVGEFSGYASTFGNVDRGGDIMAPGCFAECLREAKSQPLLCWMHDMRNAIGDILSLSEDQNGLRIVGKLWTGKGIADAERACLLLAGTGPKGVSIGFYAREFTIDELTGVRTITKAELREVSVVGWAMNDQASVRLDKAEQSNTVKCETVRALAALVDHHKAHTIANAMRALTGN